MKPKSTKAKAKAKFGLTKSLETAFDEDGRVCTSCGEYKLWDQFNTHNRSKTGKTSQCKSCKKAKRKSKGRDYRREKFCAKEHNKKLKQNDPYLLRSRNLRSSLMVRAKKLGMDRSEIPTAEEIKEWLLAQRPLTCYYTGVEVSLWDMHIDHKIPLKRGGRNCLSNLCVTDSKANSAKGAMTEKEFKELLRVISAWEDGGTYLLSRLRMGHFGKLK